MKANLNYLNGLMNTHLSVPQLPGPAIMQNPLPNDPELAEQYKKLQQEFINWKGGMQKPLSSPRQHPNPDQQPGMNPMPTMQYQQFPQQ